MTDTAVTLVINELVHLIVHQAKLLGAVHREVRDITDELQSIKCFLKDAEKGRDLQDGVRIWVKQVREVAYNIEDVMDEYILRVARCRHQKGFVPFLHKIACSVKKLKLSHDIATKIKDVKIAINEIKERSIRYGFNSSMEGSSCSCPTTIKWNDPRVGAFFIEEDEVVGIEATRDELVSWLVGGVSGRLIISLVGMGGIGKTTLAKKVYDNESVKRHFDCCIWIIVSQSYNVQEILMSMARQIHQEEEKTTRKIDMMDDITLISLLRKYLQHKRYVLVFDDVWKIEFWEIVKHALPCNDRGSRIIITTRSNHVGAFCKESPFDQFHKLQPLSREKAWELFCKKAFRTDFEGRCPEELMSLSQDIVKKCEGLPLAIVAIGGLLSTKEKVALEWRKFHDSLNFELQSNPHLSNITKILSLSYYDLPHHLKSCLLYFSVLPEDYSIADNRLFWLWTAEGFIGATKGKQMEEVAEEFLMELVHRNLVQVSFGELDYQLRRKYRIHDLLHDIIVSKAQELNICQVLRANDASLKGKSRFLAIHDAREIVLESIECSWVRSIFLFSIKEISSSFLIKLFKKFKLLKVLDFQNAPVDYLPKEVGDLFHLKHLSLRRTKVKMLPRSVGRLENLQTLNVLETPLRELPIEIFRLVNLRHLLAHSHDLEIEGSLYALRGVKVHNGVGCLKDLQSLTFVEANHQGVDLFTELRKLSQLRILGIANLKAENGRVLCASIQSLVHLSTLVASSISENEVLDLHSLSLPPQYLEHICLRGRLEELPNWIPKLHSLSTLVLSFSRLLENPLPYIYTLPNLVNLTLIQGYDGESLQFEDGGFRKLKKLTLLKLKGLRMVEIGRGSLPSLEQLEIGPCPQLKEVPSGILDLKSLKLLDFFEMQKEFVQTMQPDKGKDYWKIKNIPIVRFGYRTRGEHYQVYKLGDLDLSERLQGEFSTRKLV